MSVYTAEESRNPILRGAEQLSKVCESVIGPAARTVLFSTGKHLPFASQDGAMIIKELYLPDQLQNLGADLVRSACQKTNAAAGDGTTSTAILSYAMLKGVETALAAGVKPRALADNLEMFKDQVLLFLRRGVEQLNTEKDIAAVASSSADDAKVGSLIAEAISKIGRDGLFTSEESYTGETYLEVEDGSIAEGGFFLPEYGGSESEIVVEDAYLLLTDETIDNPESISNLLNTIHHNKKTLVTLSGGLHTRVMATFRDCRNKGFQVYAAKAPLFGEKRLDYLEDLATLTGGVVFSRKNGLSYKQADINLLGRAKKVRLRIDKTIIYGGHGAEDRILSRVKGLRREIATALTGYEREKLQERLARLTGGIAVIKIGGSSLNQRLTKFRVEDAVKAVQSAMEEGVLPGGGTSLLRAAHALNNSHLDSESRWAAGIIKTALESPFRAILGQDSPIDPGVLIEQLTRMQNYMVYNAKTRRIEDYRITGILDPFKVVRLSVENAVSVAKMLAISGGAVLRPIHEVNVVNKGFKGKRPSKYFQK